MQTDSEFQPRLAYKVVSTNRDFSVARDGVEFSIEPGSSSFEELRTFFDRLDGTHSVRELERDFDSEKRARFHSLIQDLDRLQLLDDCATARVRSGSQALLELEDLANELMEQTLNRNVFWNHVLGEPGKCPSSVFYGLAIENYHFLFRESLFDSPVLPFMSSSRVRHLMNEFYCSEYGHDEIIVKAQLAIGISRADIHDMLPLAETLAMCNALSYWAASDPIFFFATLGVLEGGDAETDLFIEACEKNQLNAAFIKPMRAHSDINRKAEHGNLTRLIFEEIPIVDDRSMARMRRQMRLFIQMYDDFYTSIWNFYSGRTGSQLVRRLSAI